MTRSRRRAVGLYIRTVRHLRPEQVAHRLRLRSQQAVLARWPQPFERRWIHPGGPSCWPKGFVAIDAQVPPSCGTVGNLEGGTFTFLAEARSLGMPVGWDPHGASQLWPYHQHYWEWAWTLANHPDRKQAQRIFAAHLGSWTASTRFGRWNAWAPYPTSLRAWVLVNVSDDLATGTPIIDDLQRQLRLHAGFLEHNLELDVAGNHLIKNLKGLLGLAVYFGDSPLTEKVAARLTQQLSVQVLGDGGHPGSPLAPSLASHVHAVGFGDLREATELVVEGTI